MKQTDTTSRAIALDLLQGLLRRQQAMDEAMAQHAGFAKLEKRDRGFVHALVALTLRRLGQIDQLIQACLDKPHELKPLVQDILRLGVAQLVFLGTPSHAAVDTSVAMAATSPHTAPYKGLVNAVLRRLTRESEALLKTQDVERLNTPDWLWTKWRLTYGVALTRAIAVAHLGEAPLDVSAKSDPALWAERLGGRLLPTGSLRLGGTTPVQELPGFEEGAWWVQDASAALPVLLMGEVSGLSVFDLCAAPGGKTMQLAAAGAKVTAVDRSAKRLERFKENLQRLNLRADIFCADALKWEPVEKADAILLDAPCSATGTIRRHPDVQRLKKPEDVDRMAALQEKLLEQAFTKLLKPGGLLIYAVCSLQPEEGEDQIKKFLERHPDARREPVRPEEVGGEAPFINVNGDLRCLPSHWASIGGLDGFFAARVRKKAGSK